MPHNTPPQTQDRRDAYNGRTPATAIQQADSDELAPFAGSHHARYLPPDVCFHVISRVFQGRHLLRPGRVLNSIILGVIGRAQRNFPEVKLYAMAFMSNHMHMMLQGPTDQVPTFIAFIKREISRRWGSKPWTNWPGTMWHGYLATALPTAESQERCLEYILAQGVKEGLVRRPHDWPGVHCARHLLLGGELVGDWLDATAFALARDRERGKKREKPVHEANFYLRYRVTLAPLPAWHGLSLEERRSRVREMSARIEAQGHALRHGRQPMGVKAISRVPLHRRTELPRQPWFNQRRRMICWAKRHSKETREFLNRYWDFQQAFRRASLCFRAGELAVTFPIEAFRPSMYCGRAPPKRGAA